jgi:hypothetical protein
MLAFLSSLCRPNVRRRARAAPQAPMPAEILENKCLLSGNVTVSIDSHSGVKDVKIIGDNDYNRIEIIQKKTDEYWVVGKTYAGSPTKINGVANGSVRFKLSDFNDDVWIMMGGGDDYVDMHGSSTSASGDMDVYDDMFIYMDSGDDQLFLKYLDVEGDVNIHTGRDNGVVQVDSCDIAGSLKVDNEADEIFVRDEKVNILNSRIGDDLLINLDYSKDIVNIVNTTIVDYLQVSLNAWNDKLNIKTSKPKRWALDGGTGDDFLNFYKNKVNFTAVNFRIPTGNNIMY